MAAYLHPADIGGCAYLAPADPPVVTNPPPGGIDASEVPASRVVVFSGGTRIVAFEGGTRTVRF